MGKSLCSSPAPPRGAAPGSHPPPRAGPTVSRAVPHEMLKTPPPAARCRTPPSPGPQGYPRSSSHGGSPQRSHCPHAGRVQSASRDSPSPPPKSPRSPVCGSGGSPSHPSSESGHGSSGRCPSRPPGGCLITPPAGPRLPPRRPPPPRAALRAPPPPPPPRAPSPPRPIGQGPEYGIERRYCGPGEGPARGWGGGRRGGAPAAGGREGGGKKKRKEKKEGRYRFVQFFFFFLAGGMAGERSLARWGGAARERPRQCLHEVQVKPGTHHQDGMGQGVPPAPEVGYFLVQYSAPYRPLEASEFSGSRTRRPNHCPHSPSE